MWKLLQWTFCAQIFRFEHTCVAYDKALAKYVVNTANLNATIADNTPRWTFSTLHVFSFFTFLHTNTRIWSAWKKYDLSWDYKYKFRLHHSKKIRLTRKMHFLRFVWLFSNHFLLLSLSCAIRSAISSTLQRLPHFLFVIKTCNEDKKDRLKTQAITIVVCLVMDSWYSPQGKGIEMKGQLLGIFILSKHDLKADNCKLIFLSPYMKST